MIASAFKHKCKTLIGNVMRLPSLAFALILSISVAMADNGQKTMLVINTYSANAPWSQSLAQPINERINETKDVHIELVNLNSAEITDSAKYYRVEDQLFNTYRQHHPSYVIMVGNFAFVLRDRIKKEWGDIPMLLVTRIDKYAPLYYYFAGYEGDYDWDSLPKITDIRSNYNMTVIETPDFVNENIDLMASTIRGMKKLVFISDGVFTNRNIDRRIRTYLHDKYPYLKYEWLQENDSTTLHFQEYMLSQQLETGLLISTWNNKITHDSDLMNLTGDNLHMISSAANPVFSLRMSFLSLGAFGGVYSDEKESSEALVFVIDKMLDGEDMHTLPIFVSKHPTPIINHQRMMALGFDETTFPPETRYIFKAPSVWEAYATELISCCVILLLIIGGILVYLNIQRKRIAMLKTHVSFIKHMPWPYSKAKILYNAENKVYDIEYDPQSMNSAFRNMLAENMMKDVDWKIFPYEYIADKTQRLIDTGEPVSFTYHFEKTDTYYEFLLCRINPQKLRNNELPKNIDIFANNITQRKKQEKALILAKEQASESDRMKSAILANMSHEIRTPLNAIVGFSSLITQTDDRELKAKYSGIIAHNNDLLLHIINDVLDLAKIESNTLELHMIDTDLNDLMHQIYDTVRLRIAAGVVFNMVLGAESCTCRVDPNRLMQVLINLLTNAAKFTQKGSITFGYEINDEEIEFFVRDTGIGISKENQSKLFQRFSKLNNFKQGTGLGLSICKSFVEKMGGQIWAKSRGEGKGSTFMFTLPYIKCESVANITFTEETIIEAPLKEGNEITVLVAEDNDSNYVLYDSILSKYYKLLHAHNGREAVEMYKQYKPQLIIMDISMPEMDGYEATTEIRKLSKHVPIIAVTAHAFVTEREKIMKSGFNCYVAKPINQKDLLNSVKTQLSKRFFVF